MGPLLLLSASLTGAPIQCGSESDPNRAIEERPGQALYELAEQFKEGGDHKAQAETLRYLIERYPASRFAHAARADLGALEPEP